MALSEHLRELRDRILVCLGVFLTAMVLGAGYAPGIVRILLDAGGRYGYQFVYISPQELLLEYLAVDLVCALCLGLPVLLYEIWAFLRPGLRKGERRAVVLAMAAGTAFACLGILFAWRILAPFMLRFLISLSEGSGARAAVSVQNYVSFLLTIFLVFAAVFELPVAAVLLTQTGIVRVAWLKKGRKVAIVGIFLVAAIITPPDVVSQIMVAVPLLVLYELSILLCSLAARLRDPEKGRGDDP